MAFSMKAGDTKNLFITIKDLAGNLIDLSDVQSIRWWASRGTLESFSRTPVLQKSQDDGIEDVALIDGEFVVRIVPADTQELNGSYYYEVEIRDAFGNVSTPIADSFTVTKDLIR